MLMRDSGYALPTTWIFARSTSPRPGPLLVCFLLQVFLRPQKQVRARRLFPGVNPPTLKSDMKALGTLATDLMAF
ncbi:hypothetical protein AB3S75_012515 [Citrus x aurantiifolia]